MRVVLLDDRQLGPEAEEPPDRVQLDDQVGVEADAVLDEEPLQPLVLERIRHQEELPAFGEVGVKRVDLGRQRVGARPPDHHHRRVLGHLPLPRQQELLHVVVRPLEGRLDVAVAGAVVAAEVVLAVAL